MVNPTLKQFLKIFLERGEGRERHWHKKETSICCLPHVPRRGTKPATQAGVLTQESKRHPLGWRNHVQPTEPHWQGPILLLKGIAGPNILL